MFYTRLRIAGMARAQPDRWSLTITYHVWDPAAGKTSRAGPYFTAPATTNDENSPKGHSYAAIFG